MRQQKATTKGYRMLQKIQRIWQKWFSKKNHKNANNRTKEQKRVISGRLPTKQQGDDLKTAVLLADGIAYPPTLTPYVNDIIALNHDLIDLNKKLAELKKNLELLKSSIEKLPNSKKQTSPIHATPQHATTATSFLPQKLPQNDNN